MRRGSRAAAFALLALLAAPALLAPVEAQDARVALPGHRPAAPSGPAPLDALPDDAPVHLALALRSRAPGLDAWLAAQGFATRVVSPTLLEARGDAAAVLRAFGVRLVEREGLVAPSDDPRVPARFASSIAAVVGLSSAPIRAFAHEAGHSGYAPADLAAAYGAPEGATGAGVAIGVTTWGPASEADFDAYSKAHGLPPADVAHRAQGGAATCAQEGQAEWDLDAQLARALAPAASVRVYCADAATFADLLVSLEELLLDDAVDVVTQSWGTCEALVPEATAAAFEARYARAAAQGIAVFSASGDGGSRECTRLSVGDDRVVTSWPATSPSVAAVGGTRLVEEDGAWSETAWSACAPCPGQEWSASGGGESILFAAPWWQPAGARRTPDVAAVGDEETGVAVRTGGAWRVLGGTSASAPVAAGAWALAVEIHGRLGAASPLLWTLGAHAPEAFRDVVTGANGDFSAAPGHDLATGWGSMLAGPLLSSLAALPLAPSGLAATAGPGRGEVTLAWNATPGADAHVVLRGATPGADAPVAIVSGASFVDAGLPDGATLHYRVVPRAAGVDGPASRAASATTFTSPGAPTGLRALPLPDPLAVTLTWDAPADDGGAPVTGYEVWRGDALGIKTLLGESAATTFVDRGCALGRVCAYEVRAVNLVGAGPASDEALAPGLFS